LQLVATRQDRQQKGIIHLNYDLAGLVTDEPNRPSYGAASGYEPPRLSALIFDPAFQPPDWLQDSFTASGNCPAAGTDPAFWSCDTGASNEHGSTAESNPTAFSDSLSGIKPNPCI